MLGTPTYRFPSFSTFANASNVFLHLVNSLSLGLALSLRLCVKAWRIPDGVDEVGADPAGAMSATGLADIIWVKESGAGKAKVGRRVR